MTLEQLKKDACHLAALRIDLWSITQKYRPNALESWGAVMDSIERAIHLKIAAEVLK